MDCVELPGVTQHALALYGTAPMSLFSLEFNQSLSEPRQDHKVN